MTNPLDKWAEEARTVRKLIHLNPGESPPSYRFTSSGFPIPEGMREETDSELKIRLLNRV